MKSRLLGLDDCSVPYHIGWLADPIMITPVINVAAVPSAQAPLKVMKARIKGSWLHVGEPDRTWNLQATIENILYRC